MWIGVKLSDMHRNDILTSRKSRTNPVATRRIQTVGKCQMHRTWNKLLLDEICHAAKSYIQQETRNERNKSRKLKAGGETVDLYKSSSNGDHWWHLEEWGVKKDDNVRISHSTESKWNCRMWKTSHHKSYISYIKGSQSGNNQNTHTTLSWARNCWWWTDELFGFGSVPGKGTTDAIIYRSVNIIETSIKRQNAGSCWCLSTFLTHMLSTS